MDRSYHLSGYAQQYYLFISLSLTSSRYDVRPPCHRRLEEVRCRVTLVGLESATVTAHVKDHAPTHRRSILEVSAEVCGREARVHRLNGGAVVLKAAEIDE